MSAFGYSITPPLFLHVHARANVIVYTRKQGTNFFFLVVYPTSVAARV